MSAELIYSIYAITNVINGKTYIGFTQDVVRRKRTHFNDYRHEYEDKTLYKAMRKHGANNFLFEVIYQSKDRHHTLVEMEPFFIRTYDSMKNGYNMVPGGHDTQTDEMRKKSSERMKTNNPMFKEETRRKVSETLKANPVVVIYTDELRKKLSESKSGDKNPNYGKKGNAEKVNGRACCLICRKETNLGNLARWHKHL